MQLDSRASAVSARLGLPVSKQTARVPLSPGGCPVHGGGMLLPPANKTRTETEERTEVDYYPTDVN